MIRSAWTRASARASGALIAPFWEAAKARVAARLMVSVFDGISVNMGTGTPNVDDAPRSVGMTIHIPLGARCDEFAKDQQRSSPGV